MSSGHSGEHQDNSWIGGVFIGVLVIVLAFFLLVAYFLNT